MSKRDKLKEAYEAGYSCGNDTSGMVGWRQTWPTMEQIGDSSDPIGIAYRKGWSDGNAARPPSYPLWALPDSV